MFLIRLSLCVQLSVNTVVLCAKAHALPHFVAGIEAAERFGRACTAERKNCAAIL